MGCRGLTTGVVLRRFKIDAAAGEQRKTEWCALSLPPAAASLTRRLHQRGLDRS